MTIANVDFGRIDAESDNNLMSYFYTTPVVDRIKSGRKFLIIGRKGSGKTALFKILDKDYIDVNVVRLDFEDYSWDAHKKLKEVGVSEELSYVMSWKFIFCVSVFRYVIENKIDLPRSVVSKLINVLEKVHSVKKPWYKKLLAFFSRVKAFDGPSVEGLFKTVSWEIGDDDALLVEGLVAVVNEMMGLLEEVLLSAKVTVFLDRLDEGWDGSENAKLMLIGAIRAAKEINLRTRVEARCAPVVIFLRSDIYNVLRFNDKNKLSDDVEILDWKAENLISVVKMRIAKSLNCSLEDTWGKVFDGAPMRQRANKASYILKRTMLRPRDIIMFCNCCKEVAEKDGLLMLNNDSIYQAEEVYSSRLYEELVDELNRTAPDVLDYMNVLKDIVDQRFDYDKWVKAYQERYSDCTPNQPRDALKELFEYSIVGFEKKGGYKRGTSFQFRYEDYRFQPNFASGKVFLVHQGLKKALELRDQGA